jgi:hypothetical protein
MRQITPGLDIGNSRPWLTVLTWPALWAVLCLAVTQQSFWMDEAYGAYVATEETLTSTLTYLLSKEDPALLAPLHVIYTRLWAVLFGVGEWALRASNIPFAVLFVAALAASSHFVFRRPAVFAMFCLSPFAVYHMNEARPYMPLIATATASIAALVAYIDDYRRVTPWMCLGALALCFAFGISGGFLIPVLLVYGVAGCRRKGLTCQQVVHDWRAAMMVFGPIFLVLFGYYGWALYEGARSIRETPGLGNIAFALYEFSGLQGLGPPRNELRTTPIPALLVAYGPLLLLGVLASLPVLAITGTRMFRREYRTVLQLFGAFLVGFVLFVGLARLMEFRFLGRHMAVLFPVLLFAVASAFDRSADRRGRHMAETAALLLLGTSWLVSDYRVVRDAAYFKDDYRTAATLGVKESARTGGPLYWAADAAGGRYYGIDFQPVPLGRHWPVYAKAIWAANLTEEQITASLQSGASATDAVLVLSKPDMYDSGGAWRSVIEKLHARRVAKLNAFEVFLVPLNSVGAVSLNEARYSTP